jgi:hypothetical protein
MPFTKKDLEDLPILFCKKDDVWVTVGPCSTKSWKESKIPLDGRQYKCGGTIIFKNGFKYRASFTINTTTFDFIEKEGVYIEVEEDWYNINEPDLLNKICLNSEDIFPFLWETDRPLDYHVKGPYKMSL